MDDETKARLKQQLLDEKARLEGQINRETQEIREMGADEANENTYSNHMADDGGALQEIDRTTTIRGTLQETLDQVNLALSRMDEGNYGLSEVSGKPIPLERLEVAPWATRLVDE